MIANLIYAKTALDDRFWGFYRELPGKAKIRSIRLTGQGISRSLTPDDKMSDREVLATFLASRDYAHKNSFAFFDLPAGTYDLTIEADGCETWSEKVKAQPGVFVPPAPIRLIVK